ncbi:GNAT family N-acetyltransferase [Clostridium estertheticum]|uniref:GNAT family N-acetyltransferase n=1 Tax=Clostridium estertheticum TaxID=238834 RepID=A0A5N7J2G9_9CLOT|nr:GNAT family N-acetyltransferase [Clostridium estertheticum]MPQ32223.1 GNAT family N-acetyltransferase [Clostridium estertheticum]MPQ62882.1 GNAT family N-acetyltransferase [Clostridium estertheticum]
MIFKLIEPKLEMEKEYNNYIVEWEKSGEEITPYASRKSMVNYEDLINCWKNQKTNKAYEDGFVPSTLYFLIDENMKIYGALHIRHELNDFLLNYGGHIGYGIRPSERKKGYATKMLSLSLSLVKQLGIKKALVTCDKINIASAKTILNNGGVLENEVIEEGEVTQRYWINIKSQNTL